MLTTIGDIQNISKNLFLTFVGCGKKISTKFLKLNIAKNLRMNIKYLIFQHVHFVDLFYYYITIEPTIFQVFEKDAYLRILNSHVFKTTIGIKIYILN